MILVFGGTTEGRRAVEVLEEGGNVFYYSTLGSSQMIDLVNGIRLTGGMDVAEMTSFCREHDIRLLVDAAHPFATELHRNLIVVADETGIPVVRYDRIYPPHSNDIVWCKDYDDAVLQLERRGVERLLALTGVKTIGRLCSYWQRHECWFRILNRRESLAAASMSGFPEDHLVYGNEDTKSLIARLKPQAILTKESGESGGFEEKTVAAKQSGIVVFAVERPGYPPKIPGIHRVVQESVDGPNGLRRAVERLLPEFFPLHSGLTTGTCATAAAVAAALRFLKGDSPTQVPVVLPDGETISVGVCYGDGYASVFKVAGDDPDVTNGIEIRAAVDYSERFSICGGEGVGTFTLPGFDFPLGEPAINRVPRMMIQSNLERILPSLTSASPSLAVTISVPQGADIAQRTFNPRLGIVGGISIIGVSGIVKPFSEEAFIESIRKCMDVAKASGGDRVVINSGAKSERFVRARYPDLPQQAFVEYGNYIGETLKMADELQIHNVTLGVMLGKAVKLAAGNLDTHSRRSVMDKAFLKEMLVEAGCQPELGDVTLARELWKKIPSEKLAGFARVVIRRCEAFCRPLLKAASLEILLIDDEGAIYSD